MQVLVRRSNNVVEGIFASNNIINLNKDNVVTANYTYTDLNRRTAILYKNVKIIPNSIIAKRYTYNGDVFNKVDI